MPIQERFKTKYPGIYYIESVIGPGKKEKIFYGRYRKNGKQIDEKLGREFADDMTPARAAGVRAERMAGREPTNAERRQATKKKPRWTIDKLWSEYSATRTKNKSLHTDAGRYKNHIKPIFGHLEPHQVDALSVDRLRIHLSKTLKPQTVFHVLTLFLIIINFGTQRGLSKPLRFKVKKPRVDNVTTEDLTPDQLKNLLKAIAEDGHLHAGPMMLLALYSGMRRGEMFKLRWKDIDFERGFINLVDPKGGPDQKIPLNLAARQLLKNHIRTGSNFIFPGRNGNQRTSIYEPVCRIKKAAGLPKAFRPLHGLRHVYASMLASSGQVDLYTLQKLLTHKNPLMTQRYAHLRDSALKRASGVASDIISELDKAAGDEGS